MKERRYGEWAGCPKGRAEDKTRCVVEVYPQSGSWVPYQCLRKKGYGPNGEYCKQHAKMNHPSFEAKKKTEGKA